MEYKEIGVGSAEEAVKTEGSAQFLAAGQCIVIWGFSNASYTDLRQSLSLLQLPHVLFPQLKSILWLSVACGRTFPPLVGQLVERLFKIAKQNS